MNTKPGRRPSDYRPKAQVIAARNKAAQEAAKAAESAKIAEDLRKASVVKFPDNTSAIPVDENAIRKERLVEGGSAYIQPGSPGSKKVALKLTLLTVLFVGLVVGSISMFFNNLFVPAVITLAVTAIALLVLSLWIRNRFAALVKEFGKDETIDILLQMKKARKNSSAPKSNDRSNVETTTTAEVTSSTEYEKVGI
jgi:hypothetical protein